MPERAETILVVDDDQDMRALLCDELQERGYRIAAASDGREALKKLGEEDCAVVLTDLRMRGMQGLELLNEVKRDYPGTNVIIMTAFGSVESAIDAMKHGAYDYVTKPIKNEEMALVMEKAVRDARLRREVQQLRRAVREEFSFHHILGKSKPMREVFDLIRRVADSQTNVLITGESGTGKELAAKAIHFNSDRRGGPFVPVNCAAIPEALLESELFGHMKGAFTDAKGDKRGLFEEANGGTLFLDEISELPVMLQAKLLRAIQEKEIRRVGSTRAVAVDVRIIAATNLSLTDEVKAKRFREDLYYRLNVIEIRMPPLRERREDIPALVEHFMQINMEEQGLRPRKFTPEALEVLARHDWPGNVRELRNLVERVVIMARGADIQATDVAPLVRQSGEIHPPQVPSAFDYASLKDARAAFEREYIGRKLREHNWNVSKTADDLKVERSHLHRKIKTLGIEVRPEN